MTEDLVEDWIKSVWYQSVGALLDWWAMLVSESFQSHNTENVKAQLWQEKCSLVIIIIPGGMTGMLQALIIINWPFKAHI
jgi:hypothetical protein